MADINDTYVLLSYSSLKRVDSSIISIKDTKICDNIKIVSADISAMSAKPPYYGDEINIKFWANLSLKIGEKSPSTETIYTLHDGWDYRYNRVDNTFIIKDNTGTIVYTKSGITSMADFHVDFNVIKSHQFVIMVGSGDTGIQFIKPVKADLRWGTQEALSTTDIIVACIPDAYRICYNYDISLYDKYDTPLFDDYLTVYDLGDLHTSMQFQYSDLSKMVSTGVKDGQLVKEVFDSVYCNMITNKVLISNCTRDLYPEMLPIINKNEDNNNRPCYEPWMIWGLYDFIYGKRNNDDSDDLEIEVFDLSPQWI